MKEPNIYDIQAQVDFMVKRFQENMKLFEGMKIQFSDCMKSLVIYSNSVKELESKQIHLDCAFLEEEKTFKEIQNSFNAKFLSLTNLSEDCQVKHKASEKNLEYYKNYLESFEQRLKSLSDNQSNFAQVREFSDFKQQYELHKKDMCAVFDDQNFKHDSLKKDVESCKTKLGDLEVMLLSLRKDLESFSSVSLAQLRKLESLDKNHAVDIANVQEFVKSHVCSALDALPKPQPPISLDDAKNAMQGKLEPVVFDAKNANLRSVNNESKIFIIEKKIEQLQLLLNKFQLQGE